MDDKLTKEECERLLGLMTNVMEDNVLCKSDAAKLISLLLEACHREKAATEEVMMLERFRLQ